jgi:membrane peptidoglycan carboxypeptidase
MQGDTIELTIDAQLQYIAERELERGVRKHRAEGGSVIIMDPRTGEVLAMANYPPVNPNFYRDFPLEQWMNRAVQGVYEPGSTFKVVTASAAMEERVFSPSDLIDASAGVWRSGSRVVTEAKGHNYGVLSFTDVLVKSSNVGAIKIGLTVGRTVWRYVRRFRFGQRLSGDLPGESPGMLSDSSTWTTSTLASVSMGYEIGVTPVQMAAAMSSVANGGVLVQPRIVRALRHGGTRTEVTPVEIRRAINAETAATLVTIMEQVVERGTGEAARLPGYTVAGKTAASKLVGATRTPASRIVYRFRAARTRSTRFWSSSTPSCRTLRRPGGGADFSASRTPRPPAGVAPTINPLPPVLVRAAAGGARCRALRTGRWQAADQVLAGQPRCQTSGGRRPWGRAPARASRPRAAADRDGIVRRTRRRQRSNRAPMPAVARRVAPRPPALLPQ